MNLPFRHLLFLVMTLISVIPISAISLWSVNSALENEFNMVHEKHLLLASNLTKALNRYAIDALSIFTTVTNIGSKQVVDDEWIKLLDKIDVVSVGLFDKNGLRTTVLLGPESTQPESLTTGENRFDLTDIANPHFTPIHKKGVLEPTLYMIRQTEDNRIWLATMRATYIEQLQSALVFGDKGHAAIVDKLGNVLAHPNKQWQAEAKNISQISIVRQMMAGETGVREFYSPAMKADMIAGFDVVSATGWGVMIPQPIAELDQRAFDVIQFTLLVGFIALVVCSLLSWWIVGLITRPIDILTNKTRVLTDVGKEETHRNTRGFHTAEFGKLFDSFRQMSLEIRSGREELEFRVADRTADLAKAQAQALHLAHHDAVTGLANRMAIREKISELLQLQKHFSLLFIDLDGFKIVNDRYGHGVGDKLLHSLADKVNKHLFISDILARYGGDEFIILMPNMESLAPAQCAAEKLLLLLREPIQIDNHIISISACIGLALAKGEDKDTDSLIHRADTAMYNAKHQGKNQVCTTM